jgi:hypothetical protein
MNFTESNEEKKSAWASVLDMLVQNRCWVCQSPFGKKQTKKVFQITHLQQYLSNRRLTMQRLNKLIEEGFVDADTVYEEQLSHFERLVIEDIPSETPHLAALWTRFCELQGDDKKVEADILRAEVQPWMSGLACIGNELCEHTFYKIVPDEAPGGNGAQNGDGGDSLPRKPVKPSAEECPPGCNCDNPWAFVEHAIVKQAD